LSGGGGGPGDSLAVKRTIEAENRGTTEKGEYRSHARMTMIEPNSWGLNEVKDQSSPSFFLKISFYQETGIQTLQKSVYI
jgi:hypothetical protein